MKNKVTNILNNIFTYLLIYFFNYLFIIKIIDSDIYFDFRTAKDLLTYGLDFKDHMSWHDGLKYLYHHWLYDLIIYPIFKIGGYPLLFFFFLTIFFIFSCVFFNYLKKHTNNKIISLITTIVLSFFISRFCLPRVQTLSFLIMLLQFVCIEKLFDTGKIKYSIFSILLSVMMVNMHFPMWILTPVFYLPYVANIIISYIKEKYKKLRLFDNKIEYIKGKHNKTFIITFILILLSGFISPFGLLVYTFGLKIGSYYTSVYSYIGEMYFVTLMENKYLIIFFALILMTLLSKKKIKCSSLLYMIGLTMVGLMYMRNLPYLFTYVLLITVSILFEDYKFKEIKSKINTNIIYIVLIIGELFFLISAISAIDFINYQYGIEGGGEPIEIADYIIDNMDYNNLKIYNEFEQGSYLAYRGIPVFVDSRIETYISVFNQKEDIMVDYMNMEPEELIKKYNFDYFLACRGTDMYDYLIENDYEVITSQVNFYYLFIKK